MVVCMSKIVLKSIIIVFVCVVPLCSCSKSVKYDLPGKDQYAYEIPVKVNEIDGNLNNNIETDTEEVYQILELSDFVDIVEKIDEKDDDISLIRDELLPEIPIAKPEDKFDPSVNFYVGERIVYDVTMMNINKTVGLTQGSVIFEIEKMIYDKRDCYFFSGIAEGEGLGYKLKIELNSYLDSKTLLPVAAINKQSGSEKRKKKLVFLDETVEYQKKKHCKLKEGCQNKEHFVHDKDGVLEHCKRCKDKNHYNWIVRYTLDNTKPTYDLLSAFFIARNLPFGVEGNKSKVRLVDGRDLWEMTVHIVGEEVIDTKAGQFDTLFLKMKTRPLNRHAIEQKSFSGLFGLKGDIALWIDKKSKIPIKIKGSYPLFFNVPIEILVKSIDINR